MKYIKTYENLNKKTVDTNKIYFFKSRYSHITIIGKIAPHGYGCLMVGVDPNNNYKAQSSLIRNQDWKNVREATPEEIEKYKIQIDAEKYNL